MRPIYIFDLDGTLADASHRIPILEDKTNPRRWRDFYAACGKDLPHYHVIDILQTLRALSDIRIWTGRSDEVRTETEAWLWKYVQIAPHKIEIKMRPADDHTPDTELKKRWLDELTPLERNHLAGVFEDRSSVVAMWRANGVRCYQVAPGDF